MDFEVLLTATGIFVLRVVGNMFTTVRLVMIVRGRKLLSSALGVMESLIFAVALGSVVSNLDNVWNLAAYSLGFAVGGYLGMLLESRWVQRFISIQAVSMRRAHDIAVAIREAGFGATESWGEGADGHHGMVTIVVGHQHIQPVVKIIEEIDPKAFITSSELRGIAPGYVRRMMRQERYIVEERVCQLNYLTWMGVWSW